MVIFVLFVMCVLLNAVNRGSDLTIADYWGISQLHPEMDDDKGTSMVFVNTMRGKKYFDLSKTHYLETSYEESWPFNNVVTSSKNILNVITFIHK